MRQIHAILDKDEEFSSIGQPPPTYQHFIVPDIDFKAKHYSNMIKVHHDGVGHYYFTPAKFYGKEVRSKKVRMTIPPLLRK